MATKCPACGAVFDKETVRSIEALRPHLFYSPSRHYPRRQSPHKRSPLSADQKEYPEAEEEALFFVPSSSEPLATAGCCSESSSRGQKHRHASEMAQLWREKEAAEVEAATAEIAVAFLQEQLDAAIRREECAREQASQAVKKAKEARKREKEARASEKKAKERAECAEEMLRNLQDANLPSPS
ncbi:hypothetical protein BDW22DRAFT_1432373 [Trametopsis cervina]|nr:hypothetical protein BDW22DRAFT_1432373 [Trametopsis cervina]